MNQYWHFWKTKYVHVALVEYIIISSDMFVVLMSSFTLCKDVKMLHERNDTEAGALSLETHVISEEERLWRPLDDKEILVVGWERGNKGENLKRKQRG